MLFVIGFIKKSLEYTSTECIDKSELRGTVKNSTIIIPFKCTTKIEFITEPIVTNNISEQEVELSNYYTEVSEDCEDNITKNSRCEESFKFKETFDEKIFCELVSSEILETEVIENEVVENCEISKSSICCNITERSVLYLTIKILQNQQVAVS